MAALSVLVLAATTIVVIGLDGSPPKLGATLLQASVTETGYHALMVLTNTEATPADGWTVELLMPDGTRIVDYWGAVMATDDARYTFTNNRVNGRIEPREIVSFGFVTEGTGSPVGCQVNGNACVAPPDAVPPTTTPANIRVTGVTVSSVSLSWDSARDDLGVVQYRIYRAPEGPAPGAEVPLLAATQQTETTISGLTPATSYTFAVSAVDAAGNESARSDPVSIRTHDASDTTKPSSPTNLHVTGKTSSTVELAWSAAEDEHGVAEYRVYEGSEVVGVSTSLSALISGLEPGSAHRYEVTAVDPAENESARSNAVTVTTSSTPTPSPAPITSTPHPTPSPTTAPHPTPSPTTAAPTTPSPTTAPDPTPSPTTAAPTTAPRSTPPRTTTPPPSPKPSGSPTRTNPPDGVGTLISKGRPATASSADGSMFGPERAVDGDPTTRWASERTDDPSRLRIDLGGTARMTRVKLLWDKACATRYSIEASADTVVWKQIYVTRSGNGEVDEIIVAGVGRYIQVVGKSRCRQDGGYSLREFEVYGTVDRGTDKQAPTPPSDLTASDVTSSSVTLSWTASKDDGVLAGYDVANNGTLLRTVRPSSTSVTLTGLAPNTRYRLTVVARDGAGNSSRPSNVVAFATLPGADNRPPVWASPVRATSITARSVTVEWDPAKDDDDALRYDVYRDGTKVATVADTGMVVTGLKPGTRYRFYVKARDTAGNNSLASNEVVVKTKSDRLETDWGAEIVRSTMERYTPSTIGGWNYRTGLYLYGQYLVYQRTGDRAQLAFVTSWVDRFVDSKGNLQPRIEHLDAMLSGRLLLALYRETGANRYRIAATKIRDRFNTYPRTSDGGFWHAAGIVRAGELWADGVFMSMPFLAEYGRDVGDQKSAWDEVTKQLLVYAGHLQMENGLLRHAYSEARDLPWSDRATGLAPEHWCRAVGWFGMATVQVLDTIPANYPRRDKVLTVLADLVRGLATYQDKATGRWFQVMDKGSRSENWTETSCSSMHTYVIDRAVEKGYVKATYQANADRGFLGVLDKIALGSDGRTQLVDICVGTNVGDYTHYINRPRAANDFHGLGAFILMYEQMRR